MISISILFLLAALHFLADFVLQTDWQAKNKWTSTEALLKHVSVYTAVFAFFFGWKFAFFTFLFHTNIDAVTSKWTHKFAEKQEWHNFFMVVGFDQFLHLVQLVLTFHNLNAADMNGPFVWILKCL